MEKLTRKFGALTAVDQVDLEVAAGSISDSSDQWRGKSTTIKMLTGLLTPTSGKMQLLRNRLRAKSGGSETSDRRCARRKGLFERLTEVSTSHLSDQCTDSIKPTTKQRSDELLEFMQLADRRTMIADYSHGMQKKLALAAAVIHGARILFLDEPFEGVDALAAGR